MVIVELVSSIVCKFRGGPGTSDAVLIQPPGPPKNIYKKATH